MSPETLRAEIIAKVREYYRLAHQPAQEAPFVPGSSRINYAGRVFDDEELALLTDATLEFWLTHGRYARQFEHDLAEWLGTRFVLTVNSGSSANLLAFMTLTSPLLGERRIRRGDEVITVAAGFPTTVAPIIQYGAVPVFVDIELATANVDPSLLEAAWSPRTKAVMLAHTLGNPFDLEAVTAFCRRHGLWLIEDNCDALGSQFAGRFTGTWGDLGTSSFYPPHHITMGEGGAVYTDDPLLHKIALSMRDWGRDCWCNSGDDNTCGCRFNGQFGALPFGYDHKYVYSHFGYNLKPTDLQAAVGCAQLAKLPHFTACRQRNFQRLQEHLAGTPFLRLPECHPKSAPSWFGFLIRVDVDAPFTRNDLTGYLEKHGIQTRNLFAGNLTRHPCFDSLASGQDYRLATPLANTDTVMHQAFWLGLYPGMTEEKIDYMAATLRRFVALP
jgi:CDP-6-deoxy-D-xylo-4-hexulose-3-dehydrase